jgi:hypothetical protein
MTHRLPLTTGLPLTAVAVAAAIGLAAPAAATTPAPSPGVGVGAASVGSAGGSFPTVDVFYRRTDGRLVQRPDVGPAVDLAGFITSAPAALSLAFGEFYGETVYARGGNGAIWSRTFSDGEGEWQPWRSWGGQALGSPGVSCAVPPGEEAPESAVYVRGTNGSLWRSTRPGAWSDVGGRLLSGPGGLNAAFGVCPAAEAAYAVGADRAIWQYTRAGWSRVGGVTDAAPSATVLPDGSANLAALGTDGRAWVAARAAGSTTWTAFQPIGGRFTSPVTIVVDAQAPQARLVFGLGTDGNLWQARNVLGTGTWTFSAVP